jgi:hypothetical protein
MRASANQPPADRPRVRQAFGQRDPVLRREAIARIYTDDVALPTM